MYKSVTSCGDNERLPSFAACQCQLNDGVMDRENSCESVSDTRQQIVDDVESERNKEVHVVSTTARTSVLQNQLQTSSDLNVSSLGIDHVDRKWYPMKQPVGQTR